MKLVLTGSIGMGKSTVAEIFQEFGVAIWSADRVVSRLYQCDAELKSFVRRKAPNAIENGVVILENWRAVLRKNPDILTELEALIHPKVQDDRTHFEARFDVVLCEIPLYFEGGEKGNFDYVIVVTANPKVQRERVLARGKMNEADFEFILSRQIPDEIKRERADFIIHTDCSLEETRVKVHDLLMRIGVLDA